MKVLVACEMSGRVRDAFARRGHNAWSCDLLASMSENGNHTTGDVLPLLNEPWDLLIAHPPCTRLCNSGVRWLHERNLWADLDAACKFFCALLNAPIARRAIENPIPHKYAMERIGAKYSQVIQPWQFGHQESKATCLWLHGLPELKPTNIVKPIAQRIHRMAPGPMRSILRSLTYTGIAEAMATQWGS